VKYLFVLLLATTSCATVFKEPDWKFDCGWARFWDFQQNSRSRLSGLPAYSQMTQIFCHLDPTAIETYQAADRAEKK
jgi:hypothetical protein